MLDTLFKNPREKTLTKYNPKITQINEFGAKFKTFTDDQLKEKVSELKQRLQRGDSKDLIVYESFALVREATERVLGLRHFDVQLIGGLVLLEGKIAEMKTGEGKTLVALLPTFFLRFIRKGSSCSYSK